MDGGEADGLSGLMRCDSERAESSFTGSATHNVLTVATGTGAVACVLWFAGISTFRYVLAHVHKDQSCHNNSQKVAIRYTLT